MIQSTSLSKRLYSTSSKNWMSRQAKDPYCKLAKANQYRARSAFKLIQINDKYRIIQRNDVVVDCGAAPGGWTQVAAERVTKKGLVIGIDLLPVDPIPNAHLIRGNFMRLKTQNTIRELLDGRSVDLVCSDMAPSFSGNHTADHARSMELCESALTFAEKVLSPGGSFVAKFLMGGTEHEFRKRLQTMFAKVKTEKPDASRKQSTEGFFVALGYKPLPKKIVAEDPASESTATTTTVDSNAIKEISKEDMVNNQAKNDTM